MRKMHRLLSHLSARKFIQEQACDIEREAGLQGSTTLRLIRREDENMNQKYLYLLQRVRTCLGLMTVVLGVLLLTACGSVTTSGAGAAAPTTIGQTQVPTPTPTVAPITTTPASGSTQTLMIINDSNGSFGFSPVTFTIKVGTTVIWKNMSSAPHTVTSDDGQTFDSGTVQVGGTFQFTFKNAGTFSYHCNIHPYMRAKIIVV
jgi:plastocyanin